MILLHVSYLKHVNTIFDCFATLALVIYWHHTDGPLGASKASVRSYSAAGPPHQIWVTVVNMKGWQLTGVFLLVRGELCHCLLVAATCTTEWRVLEVRLD